MWQWRNIFDSALIAIAVIVLVAMVLQYIFTY